MRSSPCVLLLGLLAGGCFEVASDEPSAEAEPTSRSESTAARSTCTEVTVVSDADGDGLGDPKSEGQTVCYGKEPEGTVRNQDDCDDADPSGLGNSTDADRDGTPLLCAMTYIQERFRDCDDTDPTRNPDAEDPYFDGIDSDCDSADFPLTYDCDLPTAVDIAELPARDACGDEPDLFVAALADCWTCEGAYLELIVGNRGNEPVDAVLSFDGVLDDVGLGTLAARSVSEPMRLDVRPELPIRIEPSDGRTNCAGAADSAFLQYRLFCDP